MPYKKYMADGLVVESEIKQTTIRVFDDDKRRLFSCEVTTISPTDARITNAAGIFNKKIRLAIENWLVLKGYEGYTYERANGNVRYTPLKSKNRTNSSRVDMG